jgi:DNA-binding NarL/FixJ family response regulator
MRIMVVDDHELMRRGIRNLLESTGHEVCGEAVDGGDAIIKARELKPDIIIMDLSLPTVSGLEATRRILYMLPQTAIIIFSQYASSQLAEEAFWAGARAYVVKSSASQDLLTGIEKVIQSETFKSTDI